MMFTLGLIFFTFSAGKSPSNRGGSISHGGTFPICTIAYRPLQRCYIQQRGCCKYLQHPQSEERKVKSEENRCPFGTFLIIFVRKYHFFSLFILLSSLGCYILQQPLQIVEKAPILECPCKTRRRQENVPIRIRVHCFFQFFRNSPFISLSEQHIILPRKAI